MSNLEEKFQAYLKESVSSEESSSTHTIPGSRHETLENTNDVPPCQKTYWWLKGGENLDDSAPITELKKNTADTVLTEKKQANISTQSSVSSSMAEFLEKEKMCKEGSKTSLGEDRNTSEGVKSDASPMNVEYTDDFTDDDISSIMDQLSQLAGSGLDDSGKSVDDILKEAEEVVRESSRNFRGNSSGYNTLTHLTSSKESFPAPHPLSKPSLQLVSNKDLRKTSRTNDDQGKSIVASSAEKLSLDFDNNKKLKLIETEMSVAAPLLHHGNAVGTADVIFELINKEVENEVAAAKEKKNNNEIPSDYKQKQSVRSDPVNASHKHQSGLSSSSGGCNDEPTTTGQIFPKKTDCTKTPFFSSRGEPLSIVLEESLSEASLESLTKVGNKESQTRSHEGSLKDEGYTSGADKALAGEKQKYLLLKVEMEQKERDHKNQIERLKCKHEEVRFTLEKDVYLLKAQLTDLKQQGPFEQGGGDCRTDQLANEHRLKLLESEIQEQEKLIIGYQHENVKFCQDIKQLKNELKTKQSQLNKISDEYKPTSVTHLTIEQANEYEKIKDTLKNKEELIVQLKIELESFKKQKEDSDKSSKALKSSNSGLLADVEKYKQLASNSSKPATGSNKTAAALTKELNQLKQDFEKKSVKVDSMSQALEEAKNELENKKLAMSALVVEKKLKMEALEVKVGELQIILEKEKNVVKQDKKQKDEDSKQIQDLNRQVKEMERILKRNHPNSISALILTANSGEGLPGTSPRIKYLENRVEQLEKELEMKRAEMEGAIQTIEGQYQAMKEKYDTHRADITSELASWKHDANQWRETSEKNKTDANFWKEAAEKAEANANTLKDKIEHNKAEINIWKERATRERQPSPVLTDLGNRVLSMEDLVVPQEEATTLVKNKNSVAAKTRASKPPSAQGSSNSMPCQQQLPPYRVSTTVQTVREEAHLLATIRGLKAELAGRDKSIRVLEKKLDETSKTNKRLQRERENLLNRDAIIASNKIATSKGVPKKNELVLRGRESDVVFERSYSSSDCYQITRLRKENEKLKELNHDSGVQIRLLNDELSALNDKRLQDLEELQEEHASEMARVLSEHSVRNSGTRVSDLKRQVTFQELTINRLKDQITKLNELQDEFLILRVEREHLEKSLLEANRKLARFRDSQAPEEQHYNNLREQMGELERRHECREQRLQAVIRDLLRRNNAQRMTSGIDNSEVEELKKKVLEKNQQLEHCNSELNIIIAKVKEYEQKQSASRACVCPCSCNRRSQPQSYVSKNSNVEYD